MRPVHQQGFLAAQPEEEPEGRGYWRDGAAASVWMESPPPPLAISSSSLHLSARQSMRSSVNHPDVLRWADAEVHINALLPSCDLSVWLRR